MSGVLVSAGDASGDLHAGELVGALRARIPDLRVFGMGGSALEKAGVDLVVHQRELAIGGFLEVLSSGGRAFRAWRRMGAALTGQRPDLVVLVDSPDFNLPFARRVRRAGVPVLYYICPQVWAWRRGRIRKIARRVDRLAAIFPFEPKVFAGTGLRAEFVGHPLVDRIRRFAASVDRTGARAALGMPPDRPLVALLPGSRRNELRYGLSNQLEAAEELHRSAPGTLFVLALAPSIHRADVEAAVEASGLPVCLVEGRTYEAILASDVALAKPGTITVEIALLGRPMVVAGRANPLSVALARRIIRVPSFTMPNLIAGAPIVPEFLQEQARPERIARALLELMDGPARDLQLARLAAVGATLGKGGAAERAADLAVEMLRGPDRP